MPNAISAKPLTVSELTRRIKSQLESNFPDVWIAGEISNLRVPGSGHAYFTLKDANAQLAVVLFRNAAGKINFKLTDGLAVVAFGDISVYERQGQYQLIVRQLLPQGVGALQLAFEELKRRLHAEGLFDPARKKPIPALPQHIGVVTSPTGAAIRDFLNIVNRRFPNLHIIIHPVRVQGEGAAQEIAGAIDYFNACNLVDVLIVTRGGGALEDLWAFNEEIVARALARSRIPTISAVGHEIDFTISDFVADLRAPTPSAAAELVVKARQEFERQLADYRQRLRKDLRLHVAVARQHFTELAGSYVLRQPAEITRQYQQRVDDLQNRLSQFTADALGQRRTRSNLLGEKFKLLSPQVLVANWHQRLAANSQHFASACARYRQDARRRLDVARGKLDLLSPKSTLARGYSITRLANGRLVKVVHAVKPGDTVRTLVTDGEFESVVSSDQHSTR